MRHQFLSAALAVLSCGAAPLALPSPAAAEAPATIGPAIGAPAPFGDLTQTDGVPADLAALSGAQGTVAVFFRSADWCPYCKKQLRELEAAKAPLADRGWSLIAISYDTPETLARFASKNDVTYPLLSDPGSDTIKAFNLLNADMKPSARTYGVPHPAVVFVGADGTVKAMLREEGYKDRPANEAVIEAAEALK